MPNKNYINSRYCFPKENINIHKNFMISQEEPMVQFVGYLKPNDQYWKKFSKLIVETNIKKKEDV